MDKEGWYEKWGVKNQLSTVVSYLWFFGVKMVEKNVSKCPEMARGWRGVGHKKGIINPKPFAFGFVNPKERVFCSFFLCFANLWNRVKFSALIAAKVPRKAETRSGRRNYPHICNALLFIYNKHLELIKLYFA